MTPEARYLINTIKYLLHNGHIESVHIDNTGSINYDQVFNLAKQNSIACMAAYRITKDDSIPDGIRKKFEIERLKVSSQQIKQSYAVSEIKDMIDAKKAKALLLKGSILKDLYPEPHMRSMSDIDFFMKESDIKRIRDAMQANGYISGMHGFNSHYVFKKDVVTVEIHSNIESIYSAYGEKVFKERFPNAGSIQEAMDVWEHSEPMEGSSYLVQLNPEYHYLYVIMHMMRHFMSSGTGIRSFIDIWVMNHRYEDEWDRKALNELLEKFGLLKFEQYALALTDRWFNLDVNNCLMMNIDEEVMDQLEEYVLKSGVYGLNDNHVLMGMKHDTTFASRIKYLFSVVFQPIDKMTNLYPILNKAPALLPATWAHRMFDLAVLRGKTSRKKLKAVVHADQAQADKIRKLFDEVI